MPYRIADTAFFFEIKCYIYKKIELTMEETTMQCPYCKKEYTGQVDKCPHCGYPITGTKEEQGVFVGQRILMKGDIDESKSSIKRAKVVLIVLACLYACITVRFAILFKGLDFYQILILCSPSILITILFSVCIFLLKKRPVLSLWMSLILYVLLELYSIINLRGILLIAIVIAILIKGLYDVKKAEKAEEELKIK